MSRRVRNVEVKTRRQAIGRHSLFGPSRFYAWPLSQKHESVASPDLVYCFVALGAPGELPKFFLVPAREVAEYVRWEHQTWLNEGRP